MGTNIEWTNETWNPTTGCDRISPGCANCYALTLAKRLKAMGQARYQKDGGRASGPGFGLTLHEDALTKPLHWKTPRRVFVNSMSDLFHEDVPFSFVDRVFAVMLATHQHTYQVLTKRPERMREYMTKSLPGSRWLDIARYHGWYKSPIEAFMARPLPNVWLGVTVENQHFADERIPLLLDTPAAVRFISAEPLLGAVEIGRWLPGYVGCTCVCGCQVSTSTPGLCTTCMVRMGRGHDCGTNFDEPDGRLDWVIVGGESGPRHRPFDPDWARSIVAQCADAGVACFVKQLGGARPGNKLEDLPGDLRVREFPR
ncbi:MAG: DUF5131 family protein [Reyranella sp.]